MKGEKRRGEEGGEAAYATAPTVSLHKCWIMIRLASHIHRAHLWSSKRAMHTPL